MTRQQRWRANNPERAKEAGRRWRTNHPGLATTEARQWALENPVLYRLGCKQRSANRRASQQITRLDLELIWIAQGGDLASANQAATCPLCGLDLFILDAHLDHKIPMTDGGSNTPDNIHFIHGWVCHTLVKTASETRVRAITRILSAPLCIRCERNVINKTSVDGLCQNCRHVLKQNPEAPLRKGVNRQIRITRAAMMAHLAATNQAPPNCDCCNQPMHWVSRKQVSGGVWRCAEELRAYGRTTYTVQQRVHRRAYCLECQETPWCAGCHAHLLPERFCKDSRHATGLAYHCRSCARARRPGGVRYVRPLAA